MKKEFIDLWLKTGIIRIRQKDNEKIKSMINSAEINAKVAKTIQLDENSATLIFREIYESIRQLGDAEWWLLGYEPSNHEISLEALKEMDIKEKIKLNSLDRFKKTRHDINYRGFRSTTSQAEEILDFWNKCGEEIVKVLRKELGEKDEDEKINPPS
ncbi:hypothetical protein HYU07_06940 [Candidatus Woesearchaeota archaeon]|nr:hypothetical protein [Candidatus Woesearchaeota archaeon]